MRIDFALGFGCHVANDEVGHHANGFLNPPSADHDIEFNLDAMIFHEFDTSNTIVNGRLSEDVIDLIQKSASSYHKMSNGSTAPIDRARMQSAINRFQISLRLELAMVRLEPCFAFACEMRNVSHFFVFAPAAVALAETPWRQRRRSSRCGDGRGRLLKFSDLLGHVRRMHSIGFAWVRMRSDAFVCVQTLLEIIKVSK